MSVESSARARSAGPRSSSAVLSCGSVNHYEADSLAPSMGETVPCLRHGYCEVVEVRRRGPAGDCNRLGGAMSGDSGRRPRRSVDDLLDHLAVVRSASYASLRRQGFTLRLITLAARAGQVRVDDARGKVHMAIAADSIQVTEQPREVKAS